MDWIEAFTAQNIQVLFSFAVSGYLLLRFEKTLAENTKAIYALKESIEKKEA